MMIKASVPLAEAARRLGHSVETLVSTYIGAMEGDDTEANAAGRPSLGDLSRADPHRRRGLRVVVSGRDDDYKVLT